MPADEPSVREKRAAYAIWFCIALGVDLAVDLGAGEAYSPSLVGIAIMAASVLYLAWSWIRER